MRKIENLFLVAGNGRNSGKTTMICRVIRQFIDLGIISIKISPHFHEPSAGLILISKSTGYIVYEETKRDSLKDTSRILQCGALKVFYVQVADGHLDEAFIEVMRNIPEGSPIVCESPGLIRCVKPGVFVIMISGSESNKKDISGMRRAIHSEYTITSLGETGELPFSFKSGRWISKV